MGEEEFKKILVLIRKRLVAGEPVLLYCSVHLPVDSMVLDDYLNSDFDVNPLFRMGLQGWETVGVVPQTIGVGLSNSSAGATAGITWGGGLGGNVTGVYVLLRKSILVQNLQDPDVLEVIKDQARSSLN